MIERRLIVSLLLILNQFNFKEEAIMDKIKVLFQKEDAKNTRTGEIAQVVFQHFSKPFNFRDPKNEKLLGELNCYRKRKFGDLKPAMEGDVKMFAGKEVFEIVVDIDGNSFERAHYKTFAYEKWHKDNFDPLEPRRKWKPLSTDEKSIVNDVTEKKLGAALQDLCPGQLPVDLDFGKVAADSKPKRREKNP